MKRLFSILLCIVMMLSLLSGCSSGGGAVAGEETVAFTDSLGRTVQIPKELTRIAPSGSVATMILATIAPEYMVSVSATPSSAQYRYLPQNLLTLPTTGQMYGSKSTLNLETLLSCNAQLVIDLGDRKENMEQDLDALQKQIGIPVIFLEADVAHMEKMYRTLGSILSGKEARGNELADFAADTVDMAAENSAKITDEERVRVMYTSGVSGLDTNADGSTQAQVLSLVGAENAVVVPEVSNRGGGNTINLEQLYNFDPDVIVFAAGSIYVTAGALLMGVPVALLTAIYLAFFCPKKLYRVLKPAVELLAGIPSVVYGFFGIVVLVPMVRALGEKWDGSGNSMLTASILLAIMILPTIIGVVEPALRAVPRSDYEGALALGATHERSVYTAVVPAARSGILAGVVLGVGRAMGETMAVIMVAGNQPRMPKGILQGVRTLTGNIVIEMGYAAGLHREALIATGVVLFVFILLMNLCFSVLKRGKKA